MGVDGLDFDLLREFGAMLPALERITSHSAPHASVFPPDSVPSWTSIVTGLAPEQHGQLSNVKFFLESAAESTVTSNLSDFRELCFWELVPGDDIAIVNPFLAYPPWSPKGRGAMISGPPFAEAAPELADPRGLLVGPTPSRMGGFARIPGPSELEEFSSETLALGQEQFDYAIRQLRSRHWDMFFFTSLVIDRVEHYTWRQFRLGAGGRVSDVIPKAHRQLDNFLAEVMKMQQPGDQLILVSDHGHGPRAAIGVNLQEVLRRKGLYRIQADSTSLGRRVIEFSKTMSYSVASRLRVERALIAMARRVPQKRALKAGTYVGRPDSGSVVVPDLAGSNPFGGIDVPDGATQEAVIELFIRLEHRGRRVFRWIEPCKSVLPTGSNVNHVYPDLLFELEPGYGPTWNLYGPIFAPIITRRVQSGGHTRRGVCAGYPPLSEHPRDSLHVSRLLRSAAQTSSGP